MDPAYGRAKAGQLVRTYIQHLCEHTGCSPEELPEAMNDRENGERGSGIYVQATRHDDNDDDDDDIYIYIYKNDTSYIKQILEGTSNETAAVQPPNSHLWNPSNKMNKTCRTQLEKQGQTHKRRFPMNPFTQTCKWRPTHENLPTTDLYGHRV